LPLPFAAIAAAAITMTSPTTTRQTNPSTTNVINLTAPS
jgi:hypothetical protein